MTARSKSYFQTRFVPGYVVTAQDLDDLVDSYVDQETGKSLVDDDEITKLAGLGADTEIRLQEVEQATVFELGARTNAAAANDYLSGLGIAAMAGMRFFNTTTGTLWVYDADWEDTAISITSETPESVLEKLLENEDVNLLTDAEKAAVTTIGEKAASHEFSSFDLASNSRYNAFGCNLLIAGKVFCFYRSGTTHLAGGRIDCVEYDIATKTASSVRTILTDGTYDLRQANGGVIGNSIFLFISRYNGSAFIDMGYIKSTDLTGTSWSAYTILPVTTLTSFVPYGKLITGQAAGEYFMPWYEFTAATPLYKVHLLRTVDNGLNWTSVQVYSGTTAITETVFVKKANKYLGLGRVNTSGELRVFTSTDGLTWSAPATSNLGHTLHESVPEMLLDGDDLYTLYQDRYDGTIKLSVSSFDKVFALATAFDPAFPYIYNQSTSSSIPYLGYSSLVLMKPGVIFHQYSYESSPTDAILKAIIETSDSLKRKKWKDTGENMVAFANALNVAKTGNTTETIVYRLLLDVNAIPLGADMVLTANFTCNNNANVKTVKVKAGAPGALNDIVSYNSASNTGNRILTTITLLTATEFAHSGAGVTFATKSFAGTKLEIQISFQLANGADNLTLRAAKFQVDK